MMSFKVGALRLLRCRAPGPRNLRIVSCSCNPQRMTGNSQYPAQVGDRHRGGMIRRHFLQLLIFACVLSITHQTKSQSTEHTSASAGTAVLWTDPGDVRSRDLYWGPGGKEHQPQPPVEFLQ